MSEKNPIEVTDASVETDEQSKPSTLRQRVEDALAAQRQGALEEVTTLLEDLTAPVRDNVPTPDDVRQPTSQVGGGRFHFGEVRAASESLYRQLPEDVQRIRNPHSDVAMGSWLKAIRYGRMDAAERIGRQLNDEYLAFTGERADTLLGSPDATSGIGDGTGAPLVPLPLANLIVRARNSRARMRGLVQRVTSNASTLRVPTASVATAEMVAEGAIASSNEPTYGSVLLSKKKMQAHFVASDELLDDSSFNVVSLLTERAGSAMGALEDVQICTSNGTAPNITESLDGATITAFTEATSTVMIYADVVGLFFALPEAYHSDAAFFGNSQMMGFLSLIVDGNGRPIFTPGGSAPGVVTDNGSGQVGTIFGRPVHLVPTANGGLYVGYPRDYLLLDGGGLRVRVSEHTGWASDTVEWKITQRLDGAFGDTGSWRSMDGIASVA